MKNNSTIHFSLLTFHSTLQTLNLRNMTFEHSKVFTFKNSVEYAAGSVVSKTMVKKPTGTVTLFAFDAGQALSEHAAPFDALVQIVDGKAEIIINKIPFQLAEGESIIMPANIPHAVNANEKFKMLLTMIKEVPKFSDLKI